jgi:acyl-CoA thioesterase FadM
LFLLGESPWTICVSCTGWMVDVGTGIVRVDRSSCILGQGLFESGRCVAMARSVLVLIDEASHKPRPIPESIRAWFAEHVTTPARCSRGCWN